MWGKPPGSHSSSTMCITIVIATAKNSFCVNGIIAQLDTRYIKEINVVPIKISNQIVNKIFTIRAYR